MSDIGPIPAPKAAVDGLFTALSEYEAELLTAAKDIGIPGAEHTRAFERQRARAKLTAAIVSFTFAAIKEAVTIGMTGKRSDG